MQITDLQGLYDGAPGEIVPGVPARHPFGAALARVQNRNAQGRAGAAKHRDARERPPADFVEPGVLI